MVNITNEIGAARQVETSYYNDRSSGNDVEVYPEPDNYKQTEAFRHEDEKTELNGDNENGHREIAEPETSSEIPYLLKENQPSDFFKDTQTNGTNQQVLTEEILLVSSYGKKPADMCPAVQNIFSGIPKANAQELDLAELQIRLRRLELKENTKPKLSVNKETTDRRPRIFYQKKAKEGFYSWNVSEQRADGSLTPIKHLKTDEIDAATKLPKNIRIGIDTVKFHHEYLQEYHPDWIGLVSDVLDEQEEYSKIASSNI